MYEDKTVDNIHQNLLNNISDDYEKTIGYPVYDLTRSYAIEEANVYTELSSIYDKLDVDNLTGDELVKSVYQRTGITRKPGGYATTTLNINATGTINIGDVFTTPSGVQFKAIESKVINGSDNISIQALNIGSGSNVPANTITQMPVTLQGVTSITNPSPVTNGYDVESDDSLRQRYYERLQTPATSGNKAHYKNWAKEVTGVGDAKIVPLWNGNGTVKVVIINSNKRAADDTLIKTVNDYIDPEPKGTGEGQAPIGATVTITSVTEKSINISAKITLDTSKCSLEQAQTALESNLSKYYSDIAFINNYVSYAYIGNLIFNIDGIIDIDYTSLLINEGTSNVPLGDEEIPVLGTVSLVV